MYREQQKAAKQEYIFRNKNIQDKLITMMRRNIEKLLYSLFQQVLLDMALTLLEIGAINKKKIKIKKRFSHF